MRGPCCWFTQYDDVARVAPGEDLRTGDRRLPSGGFKPKPKLTGDNDATLDSAGADHLCCCGDRPACHPPGAVITVIALLLALQGAVRNG
jgi:hypothetical protein